MDEFGSLIINLDILEFGLFVLESLWSIHAEKMGIDISADKNSKHEIKNCAVDIIVFIKPIV